MQIGFVGLGRMGGSMARRLVEAGHQVVGYDPGPAAHEFAAAHGIIMAESHDELVAQLTPPRVVWNMVAAVATEQTLDSLAQRLQPGDVVIDGGNSNFRDSMRRAKEFADRGITLLDAGTSNGVWGYQQGYGLMVGGDPAAASRCEPIFAALAPPNGYVYTGPSGSGHFAKMVHNGIEYAMLQAIAEGLGLMAGSRDFPDLDVAAIAKAWQNGGVIRSWLLELSAQALEQHPHLADVGPQIQDSGEGKWTVVEAVLADVPVPLIALALMTRYESRGAGQFSHSLIAAVRYLFGGHAMNVVDPSTSSPTRPTSPEHEVG